MTSVFIALLILLGVITSPEQANDLSQEEIDQIERTIIMDDTEI